MLTEEDLPAVSLDELEQGFSESGGQSFRVLDEIIQVNDLKLGQALSCLLPQEWAIILLRYFCDMQDGKIASRLGMAHSTVHRKRKRAEAKLRRLLETGP